MWIQISWLQHKAADMDIHSENKFRNILHVEKIKEMKKQQHEKKRKKEKENEKKKNDEKTTTNKQQQKKRRFKILTRLIPVLCIFFLAW